MLNLIDGVFHVLEVVWIDVSQKHMIISLEAVFEIKVEYCLKALFTLRVVDFSRDSFPFLPVERQLAFGKL